MTRLLVPMEKLSRSIRISHKLALIVLLTLLPLVVAIGYLTLSDSHAIQRDNAEITGIGDIETASKLLGTIGLHRSEAARFLSGDRSTAANLSTLEAQGSQLVGQLLFGMAGRSALTVA